MHLNSKQHYSSTTYTYIGVCTTNYTSNIARKWASHEAFKIATNMMTADRIAMIENRALGILLAEFKTAVASVPLKPKAQNFFFSPFSSQQQSTNIAFYQNK